MKEKEERGKGGLFGRSRQNKKIEEYTNKESKIKTNNIIEDLYNSKNENDNNEESSKDDDAIPKGLASLKEEKEKYETTIDTSDVLSQLKKMKEEIQKEVEENNLKLTSKLESESKTIDSYLENKMNDVNEIDDIEIKEEDRADLDKKVAMFLGQADKIKEKNEKIISGEYISEKESVESKFDEQEQQATAKLQEIENAINKIEDKSNTNIAIQNAINKINNNTNSDTEGVNVQNEGIENLSEGTEDTTNQVEEDKTKLTNDIENSEEKLKFIKEKINQIEENPEANVVTEDFKEMYAKLFGTVPKTEEDLKKEEEEKIIQEKVNAIDIVKDNISIFEEENEEDFKMPSYKFIGIAFKTYIILEMDKELYILDQHAAHERIMYEKVKENYYKDTDKDSQMLLLPDVITLTHKEMDIAKENMNMFRKAGFELEEFGDNTIKLTGCPTVCLDLDTKEMFLETLDEINTVARTARQEKEEKFIATIACKAAVKAHMALDEREVDALMDKLLRLPNPFTCPHGRPTAIKMTQYDIERKFSRK